MTSSQTDPSDDFYASCPSVLEARKLVASFYNAQTVSRLCERMLTRLFPMTAKNLEEWESTPEDFFNEQEIESWQDKMKVRGCILSHNGEPSRLIYL